MYKLTGCHFLQIGEVFPDRLLANYDGIWAKSNKTKSAINQNTETFYLNMLKVTCTKVQ